MAEPVIAEFEVPSGPQRGVRIALHGSRLVVHGGAVTETIALAHLASVRVAFERDGAKLRWGVVLGVLALAAFAAAAPLQAATGASLARLAEHSRGDALDSVLYTAMAVLGGGASLLPALAAALAAGALALFVYFALGRTTLSLAFAATERECSVRGRNLRMGEFAELVGDQIAAQGGRRG